MKPAFACGPETWLAPAPDSPRPEEYAGRLVDHYFRRGPYQSQWGDLKPVLSFHRPLRDYWRAFRAKGFSVERGGSTKCGSSREAWGSLKDCPTTASAR